MSIKSWSRPFPCFQITDLSHSKIDMLDNQALKRLFRRDSRDTSDRFYDAWTTQPFAHANGARNDDDKGDTRSVSTLSTTATSDDNPGTGRTLDKHVFQPLGRKVENLAMHLTIGFLHPWQISRYIEGRSLLQYGAENKPSTLDEVLADIRCWDGSTIVAGLKSLIRQAQ